ncbi:hypothetical protein ACFQRB_12320 [Halobaculum litoreum]|uniref:Uncharacterized protein n=1 Tax=Halobaculum litoreum TaxID=3031998 RepID=A0ABD5XPG1_9EURY
MKRARITIHPQSLDTPALYEYLTDSPDVESVRTVNWNVADPRRASSCTSGATTRRSRRCSRTTPKSPPTRSCRSTTARVTV